MYKKSFHLFSFVLVLGLVGNVSGQIATNPSPADGAFHVGTWVALTWSPGDTAVSHNVYFGENSADVAAGAESTFQGNHTGTYLVVGMPGGLAYPNPLVPDTTYYWRVDEVEADGITIHTGNVWSFSLPPRTAHNPDPTNGAKFVDPNVTLGWTAGMGAKLHHVYFGENSADVDAGTGGTYKGPQATPAYTPGPLARDNVYYWRVDEFDGTETHKGDVWSFGTLPEITITDPNLIGWWKFDTGSGTTAIDWSGHENHGILFGDPQWVAGYYGAALNFDGIDDYVAIQNLHYDGTVGFNADGVTVCAWIRTSNDDGQTIAAFDRNEYWRLEMNGNTGGAGQVCWGTWTSAGEGLDYASVTRVDDGQWHHVMAVFNRGRVTIYIDGKPEPSTSTGAAFGRDGGRVTRYGFIGLQSEAIEFNGFPGNIPQPFDGDIDDVRIYDKALTPEEIANVIRGDTRLAWDPSPGNNLTVDIEKARQPLSWSPGDTAAQHDVYFGTDKDVVDNADTSDTTGVYRRRQSLTSYTPPEGVEWGQSYYWRIDQYNTDGTISTGKVWIFTVADFLVVDNFEDYDAADNQIWYAWKDGLGYGSPPPAPPPYSAGNGTGSAVGDDTSASYTEQNIVHGGFQSMPCLYDNNKQGYLKYSEAELTLSYPRDWTRNGVKALSLWFYGDPANAPEPMYAALEDNTGRTVVVSYAGNADDIKRPSWQEWNIDLREFSGVSLNSINKIFIGFGDRNNPQPGGSGKMYFDDIRLYRARCVPSLLKADVNNDCVVNYLDLAMMARDWLKSDSVVATTAPAPTGMVAHYKLDGNANDSSGNDYHGTEKGGPTYVAGMFDQAISLDGFDDYVAIQNFHYDSSGHAEVSVCAWVRTNNRGDQVIASFDREEYWRLQISGEGGGPGQIGWSVMSPGTGQVDYGSSRRVDDGRWHHVAGVFDNGTLTIYIDGKPETPVSGGSTFGTGAIRYGFLGVRSNADAFDGEKGGTETSWANYPRFGADYFDGALDDVRIYERALSEAEIVYLVDESPDDGQLHVPVPSVANIYNEELPLSRSVNVNDFAVLADMWLDELLWPQP
ncbi:MAG: LamG domain-containing protein [Planctomycetota bacterium]